MKTKEIIKTLKDFNEWRRGADIKIEGPKIIGEAIDEAINLLSSKQLVKKETVKDLRNRIYFEIRNGKKKK